MGCSESSSSTRAKGFHEEYQIGALIVQGQFTQVRAARLGGEKGETVSVKILDIRSQEPRQNSQREEDRRLLRRGSHEERIWRVLDDHPSLVKLLDVRRSEGLYFFVTEKVEYSLLYAFERMSRFDEQTVAKFMRDCLHGLKHMHDKGVAHCDVQPDNFVCSEKPLAFKLTGLGSAQVIRSGANQRIKLQGESGSPAFMSPEMIGAKYYDQKTDIWSAGVLAYVLLFGQFPYKGEKTVWGLKNAIKVGKPEPTFEPYRQSKRSNSQITADAKDFCVELLHRHPLKRVSAEEALALPFITGADQPLPRFENGRQTLVPMLCGAILAGAFYNSPNQDELCELDYLLNYQQLKHHGPITPWTKPRRQASLLKAAMDKGKRMKEQGSADFSQTSQAFEPVSSQTTAATILDIPMDHDHSRSFETLDGSRLATPTNSHPLHAGRGRSSETLASKDSKPLVSFESGVEVVVPQSQDRSVADTPDAPVESDEDGNPVSASNFRRAGSGGFPTTPTKRKSVSRHAEVVEKMHEKLHEQDKQLGKAMQKGLSSHSLTQHDANAETPGSRKTPDHVERSKDSSSWIHGFY